MDLRFLSSLVAVVDHGSFAQAGRVQNLTSAAIAQRIRTLENELNIVLITRTGHVVSPTPECIALLPRTRHILNEAEQLLGDTIQSGLGGKLRVGAISTALSDYIPAMVQKFSSEAPFAELLIVPGTSSQLYDAVHSGDIDLALIIKPTFNLPKTLTQNEIEDQPHVMIVSSNEQQNDPVELLFREWLIVYDRESWGGQIAWGAIQNINPAPNIRCELDGLETIVQLVSKGLGIAIVPKWESLSNYSGVKVLPFSNIPRKLVGIHSTVPTRPNLIALCMREK